MACAGLGYASHAEVLSVPKNLCARLPEGVSFAEGAYATLGAIALQGVRLAQPTLGESVVVVGLGLLGQLAAQLLRANGCRVYGVDPDERRLDLARALGADAGCAPDDEAVAKITEWTRGRGADAVLITAGTESSQPVVLAGEASRMKGRVVVVGQVGMDVPRDLYYRRELSLQVSMSYGPGRYDPDYEERGHDYPLAYVRWTEARNIEAFLDMVERGSVNVARLTTHRFKVEEGARAYELITGERDEPYLGVLVEYDIGRETGKRVELKPLVALGNVEYGRAAGSSMQAVVSAPSVVRVGSRGRGRLRGGRVAAAVQGGGRGVRDDCERVGRVGAERRQAVRLRVVRVGRGRSARRSARQPRRRGDASRHARVARAAGAGSGQARLRRKAAGARRRRVARGRRSGALRRRRS